MVSTKSSIQPITKKMTVESAASKEVSEFINTVSIHGIQYFKADNPAVRRQVNI